jgi:para-aminobenzoate synthetase/4-amino-4-deoxychorismate lyase
MIESVTLVGGRWRDGPRGFRTPRRVIVARIQAEVVPALVAAEEAAAAGFWAAGFVSYQASPSLDDRLNVPGSNEHDPLPLVWFGVFDQPSPPALAKGHVSLHGWSPAMSRAEHASGVETLRRRIREGETYQVNLTFPMEAHLKGSPEALLELMLDAQPDSYGALIDIGDQQVVSASPELFFRRQSDTVLTMPMKGTVPRGRWAAEDQAMGDGLVASEKERAGNMMIVDMVRNDLGRIACTGGVTVPSLFDTERHPTLWQMTSTIRAELREGIRLADMFRALFPCGSVTGAPKQSTMRIIAEVETAPRSVYCGAIGYVAPGGVDAEFAVAIRTGVVNGDLFTYHVGGGITIDSVADNEYDECMWKAQIVSTPRETPDLIETMRYVPGEGIPLLPYHLDRLRGSADYWGIDYNAMEVEELVGETESQIESMVRLVLHRNGSPDLTISPMPRRIEPVQLVISTVRVESKDPLWFHKTADRSRYPVSDDAVELVLVNEDGQVTETNRSNLMAGIDGQWVTPPVRCGLLSGVARGRAIAEGGVIERILTIADLKRADELAVTNALRGWRKAILNESEQSAA